MYSYEFEADIINGKVQIPDEYKEIKEQKNFKVVLTIDSETSRNRLSAISIDTRHCEFDREEANER